MNSTTTKEAGARTQISAARQAILSGLGKPNSPEEREWQIRYVIRPGGYDRWNDIAPKLTNNNDYEGAILARQEIDYI